MTGLIIIINLVIGYFSFCDIEAIKFLFANLEEIPELIRAGEFSVLFGWLQSAFSNNAGSYFCNEYGLIPDFVNYGEHYRLFTSMFIHGGIIHLLSNMAVLAECGTELEKKIGAFKFLLLYVLSGLAGSFLIMQIENPSTCTVGASGAIFGVMGATMVMYLKYRDKAHFGAIFQSIVVNLFLTFTVPQISIGGHIGGFIGGLALSLFLVKKNKEQTEHEERKIRFLPVFIVLCVIFSIGVLVYGNKNAKKAAAERMKRNREMEKNAEKIYGNPERYKDLFRWEE